MRGYGTFLDMLARRIIPCLDVNEGRVVKGTNFVNLRDAGDPVEVAARYEAEGADELVEALELAVEELRAASELAQRDAGGVADGAAGPGSQRGQLGDQGRRGVPGEAGPQVIGAGQDQGPGLVDGLGAFACGAALGDPSAPGSPPPRRRGPSARCGPDPTGQPGRH